MTAVVPLRFQVGARTLWSVSRRLHRVGLSLEEVMAGTAPMLPPLAKHSDGYLIRSAPVSALDAIALPGMISHVRQRYARRFVDLSMGHDAWLAALSANARSSLRRKSNKLSQAVRTLEVRRYRSADELAAFHALARPIAALTYQERLLGAALPNDPAFLSRLPRLGAEDRARAWLLVADDRPIAYLWCTAEGEALRYDHVGHDPAWSAYSPGSVLHWAAFQDLFGDRFRWFDFTEGDGQHKRQFASGAVECADLILLRSTVANRASLAALGGFALAMARARATASHPRLRPLANRIRRAV